MFHGQQFNHFKTPIEDTMKKKPTRGSNSSSPSSDDSYFSNSSSRSKTLGKRTETAPMRTAVKRARTGASESSTA